MRNILPRILRLAVVTQIVLGCAAVPPTGPTIGDVSLQSQQGVASAELALQELDEIDTLIKLDNRLLAVRQALTTIGVEHFHCFHPLQNLSFLNTNNLIF